MTIDLDKLAELARAATPGPWEHGTGYEQSEPGDFVSAAGGEVVVCEDQAPTAADAAFIAAANPAAVLALVERLRAAEHPGERGSVRRLMFDLDRYRAIVRDLAAQDPRKLYRFRDDEQQRACSFCGAMPDADHADSCLHRRAVEATKP
jgi:hypothetical protein